MRIPCFVPEMLTPINPSIACIITISRHIWSPIFYLDKLFQFEHLISKLRTLLETCQAKERVCAGVVYSRTCHIRGIKRIWPAYPSTLPEPKSELTRLDLFLVMSSRNATCLPPPTCLYALCLARSKAKWSGTNPSNNEVNQVLHVLF
jgi:hypothetical protein